MKLSEVNEISQAIFTESKGEAKIIFGISENRELKDKLKVTILAVGCKTNFVSSKGKSAAKKLPKVKKQKIKIKSANPTEKQKENKVLASGAGFLEKTSQKIRRNALQVKKALQEEEEKILEKEKFFETPAFLRKQSNR